MASSQPGIGDWYRVRGGERFEVVAIDEDEGTLEIQYFDGTVEEMDREDWEGQWEDGTLEPAEAPEDWSGSLDAEAEDESAHGPGGIDEDASLRAGALDGIDLFEMR